MGQSAQPTVTVEVPFLPEEVKPEVDAAYEYQQYTTSAGTPSKAKFADATADLALTHKSTKDERPAKACRYEKAMKVLWPNVAGPDDYGTQPNPALAQAVYKAILQDLRDVLKTDLTGAVQQRVIKQGVILCRCTLGSGRGPDAFYVTTDKRAIEEDFAPLYRDKAFNSGDRYGKNMGMIARTCPPLANWASSEFAAGMEAALQAGTNQLAPALAAAKADNGGDGTKKQS